MRVIAILLLALSLMACASSRPPSVNGLEASQSLGHGFWLITAAENVEGSFESVGHFSYCYYNTLNLGHCDRMSPSPSGKFAIYQQAASGLVMFFNARTGQSKQITATFPGLLGQATWQEPNQRVEFKAGKPGAEQSVTFDFSGAVGGT
ncbi:hypothetical protein J7I44_13860 [Frateuria sp. MAH-13]|uniref:Lipocalin-like domain-containing protein n=1 Tax=Frateuria flava TaxID=2821489 RepID=A0ABS4DQQ3_9GAMM|nr:hypothetical protein [Frateuria flava]MBP1475394.1 hypothetical protein [Frateuria flava]